MLTELWSFSKLDNCCNEMLLLSWDVHCICTLLSCNNECLTSKSNLILSVEEANSEPTMIQALWVTIIRAIKLLSESTDYISLRHAQILKCKITSYSKRHFLESRHSRTVATVNNKNEKWKFSSTQVGPAIIMAPLMKVTCY